MNPELIESLAQQIFSENESRLRSLPPPFQQKTHQESRLQIFGNNDFILSGTELFEKLIQQSGPNVEVKWHLPKDPHIIAQQKIATVIGPFDQLFISTEFALKKLDFLSSIATYTAKFIRDLNPSPPIVGDFTDSGQLSLLKSKAITDGGGQLHPRKLQDCLRMNFSEIQKMGGDAFIESMVESDCPLEIELSPDQWEALPTFAHQQSIYFLFTTNTSRNIHKFKPMIDSLAKGTEWAFRGPFNREDIPTLTQLRPKYIELPHLTTSAPKVDLTLRYIW